MPYISTKDLKWLADIASYLPDEDRETLEDILDKCELNRRKENERALRIINEKRKTDKHYGGH